MAEKVKFQPQKFDINSINGGNRYGLEGIHPAAVNAPIEAAAYAQALATNQPNIENAGLVGTPSVSIEEVDGLPRFKFENLKGKDGKDNTEGINKLEFKIEEQNKQIEGLYAIVGETITDKITVSQAYQSRETANGNQYIIEGQYTPVTLIEGDTVKTENLFNGQYQQGAYIMSDGSFDKWANDYVVPASKIKVKQNTQYSINYNSIYTGEDYDRLQVVLFYDKNDNWISSLATSGGVFTTPQNCYYVVFDIYKKTGITPATAGTVMLAEANTHITEYKPYFEGLKHAYFKGIKSTGRNLISFPYFDGMRKTHNGVTWTVNNDGTITANGTATGGNSTYYVIRYSQKVKYEANKYYWYKASPLGGSGTTYRAYLSMIDDKGVWKNDAGNDYGDGSWWNKDTAWNINLELIIVEGFTANNLVFKPIIGYGKEIGEFEPYTEHLFELPEALELKKWDSLNPQTGEVVRATKEIVITGEEPRWDFSDAGTSYARFGHSGLASGAVGGSYRISNKDVFGVTQIEVYSSGWVDIYDTRYKSVEEWTNYLKSLNAAGTPLRIAYKLETPTTETIANAPKSYLAYNGGSETVDQGETDNSKYGAMPEITQYYYTQKGS